MRQLTRSFLARSLPCRARTPACVVPYVPCAMGARHCAAPAAEKPEGEKQDKQEEGKEGEKPKKLWELPRQELLYVCAIFGVTGSSAALIVRGSWRQVLPVEPLGLPEDASLWRGPWHFRLLYVLTMLPTYSTLLFTFGTLGGRREFFARFVVKMWSRFLPRPALARLESLILPRA